MTPHQDYLLQAEAAATQSLRSTRERLLKTFGKSEHKHKVDLTVVTELDTWAEEEYVKQLKAFDGSTGFLGEEHGAEGSKTHRW
ncbi:hypothetical protein HY380_01485, partial [Candidatus Saccharibacteria bacterium]|nr:hypothetical protein [Candidatus Saccharibacteria bacterium]